MNVCVYGRGRAAIEAGREIEAALRSGGEHYVVEHPIHADVIVCVVVDSLEVVELFMLGSGLSRIVLYLAGKAADCDCNGAVYTPEELMLILPTIQSMIDLRACFTDPVRM